ncbi:MAG TPA: BMC domain-containing protein, partial [Bryobacteraceae bacterium]|nr:BMC domain-containing protein [Bryobacteraceae bacterium]
MEELDSIGLVELSSVARGYTVEDAMIKAANVKVMMARTICSGKFLVAVAGSSDAVSASLEAANSAGRGAIIEKRHITRVHPSIFPAIMGNVALDPAAADALGIIETFSASSIIDVADAAVKAA